MMRIAFCLAATFLLSGCFGLGLGGGNCANPKPYQESRLTEPVKTPEDLDPLDERRDLKVPMASKPPEAVEDKCLEEPPSFSRRTEDDSEGRDD